MTPVSRVVAVLFAAWLAAGIQLSAQSSSPAATPPQALSVRELGLQLAGFGAYDFQAPAERISDVDPNRRADTSYGGGDVQLQYRHHAQRVSMDVSGSSALRYYPPFADNWVPSYSGSVRFSPGVTWTNRLRWRASQEVSYAPMSALYFFPGGSFSPGLDSVSSVDYRISQASQLLSGTEGEVT